MRCLHHTDRCLLQRHVQSNIVHHCRSPSLRGHIRMASCVPGELIPCAFVWHDPGITPCCKSLFAPFIANISSCRRGFRVNMWGTSSPGDKLTGDFGNEPDATSISDRGLFRFLAGNLSPGVSDFCNTIGTSRTSQDVRLESAKWGKADLDQVAVTSRNCMSTRP